MPKSIVGNKYTNTSGLEFTVIKLICSKKRHYIVRFTESGYETEIHHSSIARGSIKDRYHKGICNVACIGNAIAKDFLKEYTIWHAMIHRCYYTNDMNYKNYGAKGVTVCERWLCFEYFLEDLPHIEGFDYRAFMQGKLHLDKDKKQPSVDKDKMVYSLNTCAFLTARENIEIRNQKSQKLFNATSPTGDTYTALNVSKFAREHGLTFQSVFDCLYGKLKTHRGWTFEYAF